MPEVVSKSVTKAEFLEVGWPAGCIISVLHALAWLLVRFTQEKQFLREARKCLFSQK